MTGIVGPLESQANKGQPGGYVGMPATRQAQYPIGSDGSSGVANFNSPICLRNTVILPVTPTQYRYRIRNIALLSGTVTNGAQTFTGIWRGPVNLAEGNWQGDFGSAPVQDVAGFTLDPAANGAQYVSAWIPNTGQLAANVPMAVSIGFTNPAGVSIPYSLYPTWQATTGTAASGAGNTSLPGTPGFGAAYLDVVLEYQWVGSQKKVTYIGDSICAGFTTFYTVAVGITGMAASHPAMAGQRFGYVPENFGVAGSTLQYWANSSAAGWTQRDFATTVPDCAIITAGTNDVTGGRSAAQMIANCQQVIANLKALGVNRVGVATLVPGGFNAACEQVRQSYNLFVRSCSAGVDFCIDFDAAVGLQKNFSTTVAVGSNGVNLNTFTSGSPGTLSVVSTAGADSSGALVIDVSAANPPTTSPSFCTITYTGITATTFTGCVQTIAGSAVLATGQAVHANAQAIYQWGNTYPHTATPAGAALLAQAANIQ